MQNRAVYLDVQENLGKELKVKKPYFKGNALRSWTSMGSGVIKCPNKDLLNNKLSKDIYKPRPDKRDLLVLKST